jgi:hypothetical protein
MPTTRYIVFDAHTYAIRCIRASPRHLCNPHSRNAHPPHHEGGSSRPSYNPPLRAAIVKPLMHVREGGRGRSRGPRPPSPLPPPPHAPPPLARHLHKVTLLHATTARTAAGARAGGGGGEQSRPLRSPRLPTPPSIPRSRRQPWLQSAGAIQRPSTAGSDLLTPSMFPHATGREGPDQIYHLAATTILSHTKKGPHHHRSPLPPSRERGGGGKGGALPPPSLLIPQAAPRGQLRWWCGRGREGGEARELGFGGHPLGGDAWHPWVLFCCHQFCNTDFI